MKFKIAAFSLLLIVSLKLSAQVDRSQPPKAGPAPEINLEQPKTFELKNGIKVLVVESHKLPRVSYTLRIDNKPIADLEKAGVSQILSSVLGNATTSIAKDDFTSEIDYLGSNLSFGSQNAFASGLSKYSERILELMADAIINPLITEEEFQKVKDRAIENVKNTDKNVSSIANRISTALSYGKEHPYGEFISEESLQNVTHQDVINYYNTRFNPNNAYLVVIGDVDYNKIKKQIKTAFGKWEKSELTNYSVPEANTNVSNTEINFVDMPDAVQSNIIISNNVNLKMSDDDYFAALITNSILGGGGTGYLFENLREDKAYTYGAYSRIGASRYNASRFSANAEVRNEVTDSSVVEILKEIKRLQNEPVTAETLENAKAQYLGRYVKSVESPQTAASFALNIELNNLDADFYKNYLSKINAVSQEDVQRVANKYFKPENARIVVVGKGSDVLENLEKVGYPVKYYDKYANATSKPVFSKPLPPGLTASKVIDNYITALGGEANLKKIISTFSKADVTIEGMPFSPKAEIKQMLPNKESLEMSIEGMGVVMKQKFNGKIGYAEQQGQKKESTGEILKAQKSKIVLFSELYYDDSYKLSLESLTTIDGKDVFKVKVEKDGKSSFKYYNAKTSLLERVEQTTKTGEQELLTVVDYSEYAQVDNVQFPFKQIIKSGPQKIIFNITSIIVNDGVTDADFD